MNTYSFEKLDVFKNARVFVRKIFLLTAELELRDKFGIRNQIQRAAVSVISNIAEGCARISGKEQARFTEIAFGSLMEVLSQLVILKDLDLIDDAVMNEFRLLIDEIANKLNKLRASQLKKHLRS